MKRASLGLSAALPLLVAFQVAGAARQVPPPRGALPAVKSVSFVGRAMQVVKGGPSWSTTGGQEAVLHVELTAPAVCVERCGSVTMDGQKSGYMPVSVSGNNPTQFNIQRLLVTTGQTSGEVKFLTTPVTLAMPTLVSAWSEGSAPQQGTLIVMPPVMTSFVIDKTNVVGGDVVHATVTFSGPPASASAVKFLVQTTNSQVLGIPAAVTLETGKTVALFDIAAKGVAQDQTAQIVTTYLDKNLPASIDVRAAVLAGVDNSWPCCDNPFRISLSGRPPPQGGVIDLTSANPARMVVPKTVTIPADSVGITVMGQSIPGPSDDRIPITISYRGASKHYSVLSRAIVKPDLNFSAVTLTDRFGNAITAPADGQPFKLCAGVRWQHDDQVPPNIPVPPSVLRMSYHAPTGIGTSSGRDVDFAINFVVDINHQAAPITSCVELPGLAPGVSYDVKLTADFKNEVDESREGNNTREMKITRPPAE